MSQNTLANLLLILCCVSFLFIRDAAAADNTERDLLRAQLSQWLIESQSADPSTITISELDARVKIPLCEYGFEFTLPFNDGRTVRVQCDSLSWSVVMRVQFTPELADDQNASDSSVTDGRAQTSYQLVESLNAGDIVKASDIKAVPADSKAPTILRKPSRNQIIGAKLTRDLAAGNIVQASDILPAHEGLTVTTVLPRGAAVNESNTRRIIFYGQQPPDALRSLAELRRMVATSQLRPGQALRYSNLRPVSDVVRGDEVVLEVRRGPVTIETTVFALQEGVVGEQIRVRNPDSNESFNVVVTGVKRAALPGEH